MYLTQHTDYGLRVLIYTAINDDALVNISTIAETYNISKSHLMKVVTALVKGGFLTSIRGKGGGLKLAKPPEEIRVGMVVRVTEPFGTDAVGRMYGAGQQLSDYAFMQAGGYFERGD